MPECESHLMANINTRPPNNLPNQSMSLWLPAGLSKSALRLFPVSRAAVHGQNIESSQGIDLGSESSM